MKTFYELISRRIQDLIQMLGLLRPSTLSRLLALMFNEILFDRLCNIYLTIIYSTK